MLTNQVERKLASSLGENMMDLLSLLSSAFSQLVLKKTYQEKSLSNTKQCGLSSVVEQGIFSKWE